MNFKEWFELNEEKDACYHKVKSRYSVWPSAYASGALVKCRKVGAKNWGNSKGKKSKKKKHMQQESVQIDELDFEKEIEYVLELMNKHQFATSFRDPTILASQLKSFGVKSKFGLNNLASAVLKRIKEENQKLLIKAKIV